MVEIDKPQNASVIVVTGALFAHFVFRRWEPTNVLAVLSLLLVLPTFLLCLRQPLSIGHLITTLGQYLTTLIVSILLYRISPLHPLSRYPGPIWCKLSKLWMLSIAQQGKPYLYIQDLHEKYGDVVRIGPNELSICDPSAIVPLMGTQGLPKGPNWMGRTLHPPMPSLIAIRDPAMHVRRRRPWNRAFSTSALKEYEPMIEKRVSQLMNILEQQKDVVDLSVWFGYLTYDIMGDIAFGGDSELLREGDPKGQMKKLHDGVDIGTVFDQMPWSSHFARLLTPVRNAIQRMVDVGKQRAAQRQKKGSITKDLFYYLSNEDGTGEAPHPATVSSDSSLAVIAGSDTTSTALCNIFYFLLQNPCAYKRLQDEIDSCYSSNEDVPDIRHMPFLDAVINESLRLYPVLISGSQRAPIPGSSGKLVGPYYIPEGTQARVHTYSIQRDSRNFSPRPNAFWPDRWLIAEGQVEYTGPEPFVHNPNAYIPFSLGPANCVGKNLALQEMRMVLCHCLRRLSFKFVDGWDPCSWELDLKERMVIETGSLPVVIEAREHH